MSELAECACGNSTMHAYQEPNPKRPRKHHALCGNCWFSWGIKTTNKECYE